MASMASDGSLLFARTRILELPELAELRLECAAPWRTRLAQINLHWTGG